MIPTHQDLSNDTTFSQIKSRVPVPLTSLDFYTRPYNIKILYKFLLQKTTIVLFGLIFYY